MESWRGGFDKRRTVGEHALAEKYMRGARTENEKAAESTRWKKGRQAYEAPKGKDAISNWVFPVAEETMIRAPKQKDDKNLFTFDWDGPGEVGGLEGDRQAFHLAGEQDLVCVIYERQLQQPLEPPHYAVSVHESACKRDTL
jgi:hypothetical protein